MNSCGRKSASVGAAGQADLLQQAAVLGALGIGAVTDASSSATLNPRLCRVAR